MGCSPTKEITNNKLIGKKHLLQKITEHTAGINCMSLSEDGSLLITGSDDMAARMWSTQSNPVECLGVLEGHKGYITCCTIHEQFVITGSSDNTIRKWLITTGECAYSYQGHDSRITRVLCSGDYIFSASSDKTARAWVFDLEDVGDIQGEACIKVFHGHTKGIYAIVFISGDRSDDEEEKDEYQVTDEDIIITGSADCTARVWSFDTGRCVRILRGHTKPINTMEVDSTAETLFTAGVDCVIRCWNIKTGECTRQMKGHEGPISLIITHKRMLYTASSDKTARAWAMEFGERTRNFMGHTHTVSSIRYFDGILYTGSCDNTARMFEAKSGTMKRCFEGHSNAITCVEVVAGKLFTGSYDGTVMVWDTTGVRDETVFGTDIFDKNLKDEDLEEDSEDVQTAVRSLDPYIRD